MVIEFGMGCLRWSCCYAALSQLSTQFSLFKAFWPQGDDSELWLRVRDDKGKVSHSHSLIFPKKLLSLKP